MLRPQHSVKHPAKIVLRWQILPLLAWSLLLQHAVTTAAHPASAADITGESSRATALESHGLSNTAQPPSAAALPQDLMRCINDNPPKRHTTTWATAIHDLPARYTVIGIWWSNKTSPVPLTVATQLSYSRKWQLKAMCQSWDGPLSAVMHMPTLRIPDSQLGPQLTRDKMEQRLEAFKQKAAERVGQIHRRLDTRWGCKLDLMLVHEQYGDERALLLYPVNVLRNFARLQARTPLVGLIDVDVLLSRSLSRELQDATTAARYVEEAREQRKIWVLPAFITNAKMGASRGQASSGRKDGNQGLWQEMRLAEKLVRSSKEELLPLFKQEVIQRFDPSSVGHQPTEYSRWFAATKPYTVSWKQRYEPWVFSDRVSVPWADVRFRGYGKNKIVILQALNHTGYQFVVHPSAFLIHRSHIATSVKSLHGSEASAGKRRNRTMIAKNTVYGHNAWLNDHVETAMLNNTYKPQLDAAVRACLRDLSWWQETRTEPSAGHSQQQAAQQVTPSAALLEPARWHRALLLSAGDGREVAVVGAAQRRRPHKGSGVAGPGHTNSTRSGAGGHVRGGQARFRGQQQAHGDLDDLIAALRGADNHPAEPGSIRPAGQLHHRGTSAGAVGAGGAPPRLPGGFAVHSGKKHKGGKGRRGSSQQVRGPAVGAAPGL